MHKCVKCGAEDYVLVWKSTGSECTDCFLDGKDVIRPGALQMLEYSETSFGGISEEEQAIMDKYEDMPVGKEHLGSSLAYCAETTTEVFIIIQAHPKGSSGGFYDKDAVVLAEMGSNEGSVNKKVERFIKLNPNKDIKIFKLSCPSMVVTTALKRSVEEITKTIPDTEAGDGSVNISADQG